MKQNFQFLTNLPAPFPSWVHRAQPEVPICFQLSVSSSVFYRGFLLQAQKHPKALTRTRLVLLSHENTNSRQRKKFPLPLLELAGAQRYLNTTENTLNVSVLANTGPLTLISPMNRGRAATTFYNMWIWVLQKVVLKAGRRWTLLIPSQNKLLPQCPEAQHTHFSWAPAETHRDISSH